MTPCPAQQATGACPSCGCVYRTHGQCAACSEEARASTLQRSAGRLREVKAAFLTEAHTDHYVPDLERGIASLLNEARNHRHVAETLRRSKPLPTATPERV